MLGAIAGDIVGSVYENLRTKRKDFRLFTPLSTFTDDSVLTVAVADAILTGRDYGPVVKSYARRHPLRGYGPRFLVWMASPATKPYNSFGNGSAMRVSPVAHAFGSEEEVLREAKRTAECTHNHPEGIKGAQVTALAVFMARQGADKQAIRCEIQSRFGYDLSRTVDEIRPSYRADLTCQGSVPEAIIAFLDSVSFEDALRNAVSLGGDADTQACIAGAIAEAHYKAIPGPILEQIHKRLSKSLWQTALEFTRKFGLPEVIALVERLEAQ
ncbi:MAG: ADP-ribosylglycohydrolase family protein [Phycisphaerales bacterium]|nr:MAG: ADP-ribosylglycohydrolase family protein [Phycisphaerales bacterium]